MNKTTKGSLAAGAAAVLLLGGAGSLAYWTGEAKADGGVINAGRLTLADPNCDEWTYAGSTADTGEVVNFIPGDVVTKTCTFVIEAEGDNLNATLSVPRAVTYDASGTDTTFEALVSVDYDLGGVEFNPTTVVTEEEDNQTLTATIEVDIPFGDADVAGNPVVATENGNDTQNVDVEFTDIAVSLVQLDPNVDPVTPVTSETSETSEISETP